MFHAAPIAALLLTYALAGAIALLAAVSLWRPLNILLAELCGTEERSRFWTAWSTVIAVVAPMLIVSTRGLGTDAAGLIQGTVEAALTGVALALPGMGHAVWSRSPCRRVTRPMHVLITGATGFVGRHLAGRLAADGLAVSVAGRDPRRLARLFPSPAACRCALTSDEASHWPLRLADIGAVVSCAGLIRNRGGGYAAVHDRGTRAVSDACRAAGVARVVQVSAPGADRGTTAYHRSKRAADVHLAGLDPTGHEKDWIVVRPSLIVGRGGQSTALFAGFAAMPMPLRLGPGRWMLQPIHVDDLIEGVARLLACHGPVAARIDAVGPEAMTTDAITRAFGAWLGLRPAPMLPIPRALIVVAAKVGQVAGCGAVKPESVAMLEAGNTADIEPFVAACRFRPVSPAQALARTPRHARRSARRAAAAARAGAAGSAGAGLAGRRLGAADADPA